MVTIMTSGHCNGGPNVKDCLTQAQALAACVTCSSTSMVNKQMHVKVQTLTNARKLQAFVKHDIVL